MLAVVDLYSGVEAVICLYFLVSVAWQNVGAMLDIVPVFCVLKWGFRLMLPINTFLKINPVCIINTAPAKNSKSVFIYFLNLFCSFFITKLYRN